MTTADDPLFIDTNILVYATDPPSPWYRPALLALQVSRQRGEDPTVSPQILREFLSAATRAGAQSVPTILANVGVFLSSFTVVDESAQVVSALVSLLGQVSAAGKQVHDANIVATMQVHGIRRLLTHNEAHFTRFSHLITVVPLRSFM